MEKELRVALVQTSLHWENPQANREGFSAKLASMRTDIDLVVLPEMFTTGFTMRPQNLDREEGDNTLRWMQAEAEKYGMALMGSFPYYTDGTYTNRLFFVHSDGAHQWYDKRHTFTLAGEDKVYKKGDHQLVLDYRGFRICPLVCYDLRFPVWARNTLNYDILVYCANWPKPRIRAWDVLLRARAIENMAYCVGVNRIGTDNEGHEYPGHSVVYDGLGEQLVYSEREETLYAILKKTHITDIRSSLRFLEDQDDFTLAM
ncbi:MAG: nitrilase family protein [Flavobacteriaceae bacterium]